ncbi:hypothetical protein P3X46_032549 [Hevea brasiliensis]|uniref:Reverse transcriptase zinc-binding domain-containing protein n=1 Tax=Hevea brasiliensis TaxID=3981 RepID=A0ABQ9KEP2_HEVBR|nr:hypothetical protein P3X46_032549 [Hevea brasiliensis]
MGGIGFVDFEKFSLACLAKQSWRLTSNPGSVWARVLKGLYFPHSNFWQATKSNHSSWIWQSLLARRNVTKEGTLYKIRDGGNVLIWEDPWIKSSPNFRVDRPANCPTNIIWVADLIDHNRLEWKRNLVRQVFSPNVAKSILQIPIAPRGCEDKLVSKYENSGTYSVRSGYRLLAKSSYADLVNRTMQSNHIPDKVWKYLWELSFLPTIKIFMWRDLLNAIPVNDSLSRRGIKVEPICPVCYQEVETIEHCLFWCSFARATWFSGPCAYKLDMIGFSSLLIIGGCL